MSLKIALVTGGTRGIGKEIVFQLAASGFTVIVNYISSDLAALHICKEINENNITKAIPIQADVSNLSDAKVLFNQISDQFNRIDVLVNNAGIRDESLFMLSNDEKWWHVIKTNLGSVANCCRLVSPIMIRQKSGIIINISSVSATKGSRGQTAYSASKAAIIGFSKSLAREVSKFGISVNCVSPGIIDTDMVNSTRDEFINNQLQNTLLKRKGNVGEIAEFVTFIANGKCRYLIGQNIIIDGGLTM